MPTTYQKTEDLKDSGIEWVGAVPKDWVSQMRGKFVFRSSKEINKNMSCDNVLSLTMRGVISRSELGEGGLLPSDYSTFQIFYNNDLVFKLIDLANFKTSRVGIVHEKGIMSSAYIRTYPINKNEIYNKYFYYYYFNLYLQGIYNFIGMGVRSTMNASDLLDIEVVIPSLETQKRIADFLDEKTASIDKVIKKKQKLIKLLKEQRTAIITKAVTRGLDSNAKMKDSGVEWIGEIPERWKLRKLKYIAELTTGNSIPDEEKNTYIYNIDSRPYISSKDINIDFGEVNYENGMYIPKTNNRFKIAREDSLLLCIEGGSAGKKIAYIKRDVCFVNKLCNIRSQKFDNKFIYYLGRSTILREPFSILLTGLIGGVSVQRLRDIIFTLPSLEEQNEISNFLDDQVTKTNDIMKKTSKQIKKLKEYRASLIYNTVTGKIKI
jgi:type I restriction enzyme S subunit